MAIRVVIVVAGGVVQDVFTSIKDVQVEVLDTDDAELPDDREKVDAAISEAESLLFHTF